MALAFPYTHISCPCSDDSRRILASKRFSLDPDLDEELQEEEKTFNPRHPRSAFSLFPPEHLLYCEECHDVKCPRCVTEEIICWYCPNCLFETPSASVKSENNRCNRNCFNCPVCTSQLITAPIGGSKDGQFILSCNYCMWTTLDIGITLEKSTNIRAQLDRIANGGKSKQPAKPDSTDPSRKSSLAREPFAPDNANGSTGHSEREDSNPLDDASRFNALRSFYKDQITSSSINDNSLSNSALDLAYSSSPSALTRLMNLYSGAGGASTTKKARQKPSIMREALTRKEGLQASSLSPSDPQQPDYMDTPSLSQLSFQHPSYLGTPTANNLASLRPMPALLRTKRSKRCSACKHILVKPEFKASSTRYRIKLIALNYLPFVTLRPLSIPSPIDNTSFSTPARSIDGSEIVLPPNKPSQYILTLRNPLFENVQVTLASPRVTPGRHAHKVTILCPQFEIGRSGDVWDDALNPGNALNKGIAPSQSGEGKEQIAGKLYEQGRNWVSVVIEIVPADLCTPVAIPVTESTEIPRIAATSTGEAREEGKETEADEDEDVIEIPVRVRLEWRVSDEDAAEGGGKKKTTSEKLLDEGDRAADDGRRELAYWMVLGIGRAAK